MTTQTNWNQQVKINSQQTKQNSIQLRINAHQLSLIKLLTARVNRLERKLLKVKG